MSISRVSLFLAGQILSVAVILVVWELLARSLAGTYTVAGPVAVGSHIVANVSVLLRALVATLKSASLGYLCGNLAAIVLAGTALLLPLAERPIRLLSLVVFCLPLIATGPILRVLYGPGIGPQVTLSALSVFYTTLIPLLAGLRAAPSVWLELVESYGRGSWTKLVHVRAMASLPYLIAGLQIAAPAAFLGALIGEFTGAERGLGVLTLRAMRQLDTDATWAIAAIAASISIVAYALAGLLGRVIWPGAAPVLLVPPGKSNRRPWDRVIPVLLIPVVFVLWYVIMESLGLNRFFAKRPDDIWNFLVQDESARKHRETLGAALLETLSTVLPGYFAGLILGAGLAALCILLPWVARVVSPVSVTMRAVPIVTTAPLIVLWLGREAAGVITIVAVMIFFPTLIACLQGMRLAPKAVLDVFESYGSNKLQTLIYARVPASLPAFFASARIAVPAAVLAATVAEWLATGKGIGNLMALSASTSDYNMLWSAIFALTVVAVLAHGLVGWAEEAVFARYAPEQLQD
ncbi:MAG: ABC transporter permease subunit [Pseudomonadota bacterium]